MKIYFYGDSFTSGYRLTNNFHYNYPQQPRKHWTGELVEKLAGKKGKGINYALTGNCNEQILLKLSQTFTQFKAGDYVIIGLSDPARQITFTDKDIIPLFGNNRETLSQTVENRLREVDGLEADVAKYTLLYSTLVKGPQRPFFNHVYEKIFKMFTLLLREKDINAVAWDWELWEYFETISKATDNECEDLHWSYQGSWDFYEFLYNNLDKHYLNKDTYLEYITSRK